MPFKERSEQMQYNFDLERDQRAQLRTTIVSFASNLSYEDPIAIQQVAGLLAIASAEPTEITPDCMDTIMQVISKMINNLNDPLKTANTPQEDIEKAMTKIFSVIGAIMEAAGTNGIYPTLQEMKKATKYPVWKQYDTSIYAMGDKNDVESEESLDKALKHHTRNVYKNAFVKKGINAGHEAVALLKNMSKLFNSFAIPGQVMNGTSFRMKYMVEKNYKDKFDGKTVNLSNSEVQIVLPKNLFPNLSKLEALTFQIQDEVQLLVVAKYNGVPDPTQNETDFIFVVPSTVPPDPSSKNAYTVVITNVDLNGRKGKWWFGTREREKIDINSPVPTNQEIAAKYKNGSGEFKNNYNLTLWTSGCFYVNENDSDWNSDGCEVSRESTQDKTICLCNHMTTFAGGFIVVPNTIDWNFVFSHADFLSNPTLYITEIFIAVVFALAFYMARQKDKRDMTLIGLTPLADNDSRDKYFYEIVVSTGMRRNAGTNSKVYFILSGEDDESDVRMFSDSKRPIFKRGMTNRCLGRINYIRIWHDNSGKGKFGSWFLNYIAIKDLQTDVKQVFIANRWLALEEDDGQIDRIIPLAGREQMSDFSYQFGERSKKNLADGHLWFSVIARPPGSYFTCVERVACCLCLLFMTMLTNAMFYKTENNSSTTASLSFTFGPFSLSVSQIFIGFISTVIVFPVNFLLVFLFRKAKPRNINPGHIGSSFGGSRPSTAKLSQVHPQVDQSRSTISLATTASYPDGRSDCEQLVHNSDQGLVSPSQNDLNTAVLSSSKKKKCQLPWWSKIVAWVLLVLCTIMSAALVTFYGISFQVILTAILLSLIIKNPGEDDDEDEEEEHVYPVNTEDEYLHNKQDGAFEAAKPKKAGYKPLNPKELERLREVRLKEVKMWAVIREIIFYSLFLWILLVITHNNRGPDNFRYKNNMVKTFITNQNLNKTLVKFNDVQSASDFWEWLNNGFITGILANAYYNDYPPLKLRSYINDKASRIIGHAVLRQLRIKADLCSVPGIMSSAIKECNIAYNIADQEEGNFNTSWTPINKSDTTFVPKSEYSYSSAESLNGYPYWGNMALYSGGGYVAHLNGTKKDIENTLQQLQQESWIDKYTRAIFIEFTVYNPQVNLFSVNMLLAEFNLNNAILPSFRFEPAMLLPYMTNAMIFQIVCEVIFVLYIIGFIVKELLQVIKLRKAYFLMFWNWVEISIISFSLAAISIYFYRLFETNSLTNKVKETNGNGYVKFQYVGYWNEMFSYLIGFVVFLATIKYLKLLRFNRRISMLSDTLKHSGKQLFHFSIIFWIIFLAFAQLFFITFQFGDDQYTTFIQSSISLILMLMGKFSIYSMSMVDPILSQVYILVYVIWLSFILLNMFVSILTDTFSAVREDVQKQSNEYEIVDFMLGRLKKWTGLGSSPITIDPNVNKNLDASCDFGNKGDETEDDPCSSEPVNSNMTLFPSRIDRLLQSLATIYRENENATLPWMKKPYQAPPLKQEYPFRPDSQALKRRSSLAKVETS
ncbi:hypothetical protein Btru_024701 [Bulinus truncatus]|nr:hypothetical protein Btru_024701 [Bulinus truncatus]